MAKPAAFPTVIVVAAAVPEVTGVATVSIVVVVLQAPLTHASPAAQTVPHAPQLLVSEPVFVQTAVAPDPHSVPDAHAQAPLAHDAPAGQTAPHVPQLFGSLAVSTHAAVAPVPQSVEPPRQSTPQVPIEHT
jgi:hypothetical protein